MTGEAKDAYSKVFDVRMTSCEVKCLLNYLEGSRGKQQRAVYVNFKALLSEHAQGTVKR